MRPTAKVTTASPSDSEGRYARSRRAWTAGVASPVRSSTAMMREAASEGSSCSQMRNTVHPADDRASSAARSRATLRSSLGSQYPAFTPGRRPCSGQQCQKQPSTKTATRARVKTMSGRGRPLGRSSRTSTRYRRPAVCKSDRMARSGLVSRRLIAAMLRDRPGVGGVEPEAAVLLVINHTVAERATLWAWCVKMLV